MKSEQNKVVSILNKALHPVAHFYRVVRKGTHQIKRAMPEVYNHLVNLVKQNIVNLDKKKDESATFADIVVDNLIRKLPTLDEERLSKVIDKGSSKSFLQMLNLSLLATIEKEKDYSKIEKKRLFVRVLVANRGEIALRIISACKELGIEVVALYSRPEKNALFVKFADKAYCIGAPKEYLNIKKIVKIAKKVKADAIHPGYGFLSENADFARLCAKKNIKFIGPPIKALELMGNKVKAREAIQKLGIPVILGTTKPLKDYQEALQIAEQIGYPVILKASMGGGGKGMRVVYKKEDLQNAYSSAENEALAAFGDKSLYLERYVEKPRHIEVQILADRYKNAVHLGERDCSIQRRHQKLIEEAPSPAFEE